MSRVFKRVPDKQLAGTEWGNRRKLQHLQSSMRAARVKGSVSETGHRTEPATEDGGWR